MMNWRFCLVLFLILAPQTWAQGNLDSDNPFERLNLSDNASDDEIRAAYRKLAMKYHPDHAPEGKTAEYEAKFKKISEAKECLSDPLCRGKASISGGKADASGWAGSEGRGGSFNDIYPQESSIWEFSKKVEEPVHLERSKIFNQMHERWYTMAHGKTAEVYGVPKEFLRSMGPFTMGPQPGLRAAWKEAVQNIPLSFSSSQEAANYADAFVALMSRRGGYKMLFDLSEAETAKVFQVLYTADPRYAWLTLSKKIIGDVAIEPERAKRMVLFAMANASPASTQDQNGLSRLMDDYAREQLNFSMGKKEYFLMAADRWDSGTITEGLNAQNFSKRSDQYVQPRYSLNRFDNPKGEKRVLEPLVKSMKTLSQRSPRAYENFVHYLEQNDALLSPNWKKQMASFKPQAAGQLSGTTPILGGWFPVDNLEDYFQSQPEKTGLWQCLVALWAR